MEKQMKFYLTLPFVALVTLALLSVPLVAMQFTDQVKWGVLDFVVMGALIFSTGTLLVVVLRQAENIIYRVAMVVVIGATFLMIWVNMAVGLIGSGPNLGNILYIGVMAVLVTGVYLSRFKAAGLERAMFATAFALMVLAVIALLANVHQTTDSSVIEIIGINVFFATPYVIAGLLFRHVALQPVSAD